MFKIFVKTDFKHRLLEECSLDGLVELEVEIFPDYISEFMGRVGVDILLFLNHNIQTYFS